MAEAPKEFLADGGSDGGPNVPSSARRSPHKSRVQYLSDDDDCDGNEGTTGDEDTEDSTAGAMTGRCDDDHEVPRTIFAGGLDIAVARTHHKVQFLPDPSLAFTVSDSGTLADILGVGAYTIPLGVRMWYVTKILGGICMPLVAVLTFFFTILESPPPGHEAIYVVWTVLSAILAVDMLLTLVNFAHLEVLWRVVREPTAISLIVSRTTYTVACSVYRPTATNVAWLLFMLLSVFTQAFYDAIHTTMRMRYTRAFYSQCNLTLTGRAAAAKIWYAISMILIDIARHLTVLYLNELEREESGEAGRQVSLTVSQRAFALSVKDVVNSSFSTAVVFLVTYQVKGIRAGGIGRFAGIVPARMSIVDVW